METPAESDNKPLAILKKWKQDNTVTHTITNMVCTLKAISVS